MWICLPKRYWKSCRDILEMVDLSTRGFVYSIVPELTHCSHVDLSTDGGFVYQRCWFVYKPMWICLHMVDLSTGSLWSIVDLSTARGFVYRAACGALWICLQPVDLSTWPCGFVYSPWICLPGLLICLQAVDLSTWQPVHLSTSYGIVYSLVDLSTSTTFVVFFWHMKKKL